MIRKLFVLIMLFMSFIACDPDVTGEGINLPDVYFAFTVSPDTAYLKVGDTLLIYASVSSKLSNGVVLTDGEGEIRTYISRGNDIPRTNETDNITAANEIDYKLIVEKGDVQWGTTNVDNIRSFTSSPTGDSIIMSYKLIFLKKGTFILGGFQPSFYEGSKGKTRWHGYFNVDDPHWNELWQVDGIPAPQPNEHGYKESYLIAVRE